MTEMLYEVFTVNENNLQDHPQAICFINPKHPTYQLKVHWLNERFHEGLVIKLLYLKEVTRPVGFIEYVPGEYCWRAVSAPGYLFVHCIWVNAVKYKNKGVGSALLQECINDAQKGGFAGIAAMTSSESFMADRRLFEKNGFTVADSSPPHHVLMVKKLKELPTPHFNDCKKELIKYKGLHIIYSKQCPWVARFVREIESSLKEKKIPVIITEIKTSKQAQTAPSLYAVFNLVYNGKLLADHYISETRFLNILKQQKLI